MRRAGKRVSRGLPAESGTATVIVNHDCALVRVLADPLTETDHGRLTAAVMAVIFPLWGVCAAFVLGLDRFVIRRNRRLRAAFGQR